MKWGKENKLSREDFEEKHNVERGCRVDLLSLGNHVGMNKQRQKIQLPIYRLKCLTHNETSVKFVGEKIGEK